MKDSKEVRRYKDLQDEFKTIIDVDDNSDDNNDQIEQNINENAPSMKKAAKSAVIKTLLIAGDNLNRLKEQMKKKFNIPLIEEYDFKKDTLTADMKIELRPNTMVRPYQEQALSKMFSNGRARSGIIVLPCGAGKTLTGITAACTIKKSTMVVCTSQVSCEQWKREFLRWSLVSPQDILIFSSKTVNRKAEEKNY